MGGENLLTSAGKVVDFRCLALAVPIRLQNEITWTRDILSTQQRIANSISTDYNSKVGEKQFSGVRKGRKSRESKIKIHCSWFAGPTCSSYFAALSLQVQSASQNSTELRMPRGWRAKLYKAWLLPGTVPILRGSLLAHMTIITKVGVSYVDHMDDDMPEVDNFSCGYYQALTSPCFLRREPGTEARAHYSHTESLPVDRGV